MKNLKFSLKIKLSVSYALVALVCVSSISLITNFLLDKQFQKYVKQNQANKNKEVVSAILHQYGMYKKWNNEVVENIGVSALENGLIIKVIDSNTKVIWDAKVHNNGMCQRIIRQTAENMINKYPKFKGGFVNRKYPIIYNNLNVGSVDIGYYGPFYLNDNDLAFISTFNNLLFGVGICSLCFALLFGIIMAKRLSIPIVRVIKSAQMISKGDYNNRVVEKSSTNEICQLTDTVNDLAKTLGDQELIRKRLTADIAHEFRTPLSTLQSHLEAMIDGIWSADNERLKSCHEEIIRISGMIGDLEKVAKLESEDFVLTKTKFDISELIRRIVYNFEKDFMVKNIKINYTELEEYVCADRDKISQVLLNLMSNALKYTPDGGLVEIMIKNLPESTKVIIRDTGTGIPQEDIPYIFERFYRADKSRNRNTGGSGIGLTIVKKIIEAHNGKVVVKSKVNIGTEFTISLPKSKCEV